MHEISTKNIMTSEYVNSKSVPEMKCSPQMHAFEIFSCDQAFQSSLLIARIQSSRRLFSIGVLPFGML